MLTHPSGPRLELPLPGSPPLVSPGLMRCFHQAPCLIQLHVPGSLTNRLPNDLPVGLACSAGSRSPKPRYLTLSLNMVIHMDTKMQRSALKQMTLIKQGLTSAPNPGHEPVVCSESTVKTGPVASS